MSESLRDAARSGLRRGAIGGAVVIYLALVGMILAFEELVLIEPHVTLGEVVWLGAVFVFGYLAAAALRGRDQDRSPPGPALTAGGVAGIVAGAITAAFVLIGTRVDLSVVFDKARPALYESLTFETGAVWVTLALCLACGLAGAGLAALPAGPRGAIVAGLVAVIVAGALRDTLRRIDLVGNVDLVGWLYDAGFGRQGLRPIGAAAIFVLTVLVRWGWQVWRDALAARRETLPASARASQTRTLRIAALVLAGVFLLWFPLGMGKLPADVLDLVGIYILMGLGLNIVVGFAGLLDLGYVAFFAIGAYATAILTSQDPDAGMSFGWTFWQALPLAVAIAVLAGVILGVPVLKTHGDYLAIITLGFGEIIRILAISDWLKPVMGGAQGVTLIPKPFEIGEIWAPLAGRLDPNIQQEIYYLILAACLLALYVAWRLRESRFGRAWMAVREDEDVAQAMGINLVAVKLLAFASGAAFAGLAGALFAAKIGSIYPASFNLLVSINVLVLIIVGGMGSIPGVFVGALVLVGMPELLREFEDYRMLLYGVVLVFMMLKRPEGLWPAAVVRRELHHRRSELTVGGGD